MIRISLLKPVTAGLFTELGAAEFDGVPVTKADGSTTIPLDGQGRPVPFACRCRPADLLPEASLRRVAADLARGAARGEIDGLEWRVE